MANKRISKRRYPTKDCPQCRQNFIPSNRRQVYCTPQCRIDFNNDKRKKEDGPSINHYKALKFNRKALKKGHEMLDKHHGQYLNIEFLKYDGFDPAIFSDQSVDTATGNTILWSLDYGIEGIDKHRNLVKIHKRKL